MTEYLILSLSRALPLVWEYNREITFNVTFSRTYGSLPRSQLRRTATTYANTSFILDSTSKRIFRAFGTPAKPSPPAGVKDFERPRLLVVAFTLTGWTGSPQFRIDLHYANSDGTPAARIASFTPTVADYTATAKHVYVDLRPQGGYELDWGRLYSIVLVPTTANSTNYAYAPIYNYGGDAMVQPRIGHSSDGGATWTLLDNREWYTTFESNTAVLFAYYYVSSDAVVPMQRSSDAFRSYFNGWVSRTTLPSGLTVVRESINGVTNLTAGTEIQFTDAYVHSMTFYTTANVSGFTQSDTASFKWKYNINPVTIDMFHASEAYLQSIEFLGDATTTSSVRLNDSPEQEFSGTGGSSVRFDPPVLWWKAQVLSGTVRLRALVFE